MQRSNSDYQSLKYIFHARDATVSRSGKFSLSGSTHARAHDKSNKGRKYDAYLVLKDGGKLGWSFRKKYKNSGGLSLHYFYIFLFQRSRM